MGDEIASSLVPQLGVELGIVVIIAAILAVVAHFLKQPILIAYIAAGLVFGPHSPWPPLRLVNHTPFIEGAGHFGLILLLFMLGLVLHPSRLRQIFGQASLVVAITSPIFFLIGFGAAVGVSAVAPGQFPLTLSDAFYIGCAAAFSSTLLAVKLLPTRRLHESAVGTVAIGILIVQDILAIIILIAMNASAMATATDAGAAVYWKVPVGLVLLVAALPVEQFVLRPLMHKVEAHPEMILVMSVAWCVLVAGGARQLGFTLEIGALVAGLALARSPVSLYIWEKVAPLRDFFIVLLFFSLGARVDVVAMLPALPLAAVVALVLAVVKPYCFGAALRVSRAEPGLAREAGWRLGQMSEFAFVIGLVALEQGHIGHRAFEIILVATILSLVISTYLVVLKYPTPLGVSESLRQG